MTPLDLGVDCLLALLVLPVPATAMALARSARRIDEGSVAPRPGEVAGSA